MSTQLNWVNNQNTLNEVPGWMPEPNTVPYYTTQLFTEAEADAIYFNVIKQYNRKQLSTVYRWDGTGSQVDVNARYTHYYSVRELPNYDDVINRFNAAVQSAAHSWMDLSGITTAQHEVQILGYEERCLFRTHADNSIRQDSWKQNDVRRDISALIYMTDCVDIVSRPGQHSGGELVFDNFVVDGQPLTIRPRKGQMILFPSHPMYIHQVLPVTKGYRIALVNWWSVD